jgi:hypothetical protein
MNFIHVLVYTCMHDQLRWATQHLFFWSVLAAFDPVRYFSAAVWCHTHAIKSACRYIMNNDLCFGCERSSGVNDRRNIVPELNGREFLSLSDASIKFFVRT